MRTVMMAIGLAAVVAMPAQARSFEPVVGQPAPDFNVKTFAGERVSLKDLRGQVVVLNLWATWCGPCKRELPTLDTYYRARQQFGLRIFAVATEQSVPNSYLKPLQAMLSVPFVLAINGPYKPIGGAVPTNYVIDRQGVVRYAKAGAFDLDRLNEVLVPLLQEDAPADVKR